MNTNIVLAVLLTSLVGCTTVTGIDQQKPNPKTESALAECLNGSSYNDLKANCNSPHLQNLSEEMQNKASVKWDQYLQSASGVIRLLNAIQQENLAQIQELLDSGVSATSTVSHAELYGSDARDPSYSMSMLEAAADTLNVDVLKLLIERGADAHWKKLNDGEGDRALLSIYTKRLYSGWGDDATIKLYGADVASTLLDYGYTPNSRTLGIVKKAKDSSVTTNPALRNLYDRLLSVANAHVSEGHNSDIEASRVAERENQRAFERARLQKQRDQQIANEQLNQQKRKTGARVCKNEPGRFGEITYVGYVERTATDKVQIRVAHAHLKNSPTIQPAGFSPTIIWARPASWDLCE